MTETTIDKDDLQSEIEEASEKIAKIKKEVSKKIVWQENLIDSLIIWLFSGWHILLEWVPWLAKTLTVSTLSSTLDLGFSRVQFTPDLLPSDLVGSEIFNSKNHNFEIKKWPVFNNFILADEINRAPSKVQSALLEAMAERHITIWNHTFPLDNPFIVLATQNPIEQAGTYNLPEAQLDRFMLKVNVDYPSYKEEKDMYKKVISPSQIEVKKVLNKKDIFEIQELLKKIYISDNIFDYVTNIIDATRNPEKYNLAELSKYITYWVSPRWGLSLLNASKVLAIMENRSYVLPEDIKKISNAVLSHRLVLSYEAIADDIKSENIVEKIISKIEVI